MNNDMLVWHTASAPSLAQPSLRQSRSALSLASLSEPLDMYGMEGLAALRSRQRRGSRPPPQARDEVKRLLRSTGKLQEKAQRVQRRVRKVRKRAGAHSALRCSFCGMLSFAACSL